MIFVDVHALYPERRIFLYGRVEYFFELEKHVRLEELPSVFGCPDDVILMGVGAVVEMSNPHGTYAITFGIQRANFEHPALQSMVHSFRYECSGRGFVLQEKLHLSVELFIFPAP